MKKVLIVENLLDKIMDIHVNEYKNEELYFIVENKYRKNLLKRKLTLNTIKYKQIFVLNELLKGQIKVKFDYMPGNPPYKNNLWTKILTKLFENNLKPNGIMTMIHPVTPFVSNIEDKQARGDVKKYLDIVKNNTSKITFIDDEIFNAGIASGVCVSQITKDNNNKYEVNELSYINAETYENVRIKSINRLEIEPKKRMKQYEFYGSLAGKHGSVESLVKKTKECKEGLYLADIRGHVKNGKFCDDFFSVFSENNYIGDKTASNIIDISEEEKYFLAKYLETRFVALGISLMKYSTWIDKSTFKYIPLVPFDRVWTDEELFEYFDIPLDIREEIQKLPEYSVLD